jgi:hypothetical protein
MDHVKRMILIDENEYSMLKKSPWKESPDDRLKTRLYDQSKTDLNRIIPDDIKAKQLQHDFIRFQLAQLKLPEYTPLPSIPELQDIKPIVKEKKIRQSKRGARLPAKWETMN